MLVLDRAGTGKGNVKVMGLIAYTCRGPPFPARARFCVFAFSRFLRRRYNFLERDILSATALNTMATNSIKLLTGNSYPELARLVADRYVCLLPCDAPRGHDLACASAHTCKPHRS